MYKGKIVEQGSVEEILKNPKNSYTKKLLSGTKYSLVGRHSILTQREGEFDDIDFLHKN